MYFDNAHTIISLTYIFKIDTHVFLIIRLYVFLGLELISYHSLLIEIEKLQ